MSTVPPFFYTVTSKMSQFNRIQARIFPAIESNNTHLVIVTGLPITFPLVEMCNWRILQLLKDCFLLPHHMKKFCQLPDQDCTVHFVALWRNCVWPWSFPIGEKFDGFTELYFWKCFSKRNTHLLLEESCNSFCINGRWFVEDPWPAHGVLPGVLEPNLLPDVACS